MNNANNNCNHCTFLNEPNAKICGICSKSLKSINVSAVDEDSKGIQCDNCTFLNSSEADSCEVCRRPLFAMCYDGVESATDETAEFSIDDFPRQECKICFEAIGTKYFAMFDCVHIFCDACAVGYFTNQVSFTRNH